MLQGINIQYLNGIDSITDTAPQPAVRRMLDDYERRTIGGFDTIGALADLQSQRNNIDAIINGTDVDDYSGLNNVDDIESIRNYLIRTKEVVDRTPALVQSYRNPETFSNMLDYIIRYWDTAEREKAVENMSNQEKRLINSGKIALTEDSDDANHYNGFFMTLAAAICPQTQLAKDTQEVLHRFKNRQRAAIKASRVADNSNSALENKTKIDKQTLHGLSGHEISEVALSSILYGFDYCDGLAGEEYETEECRYLRHLHGVMQSAKGEFFYSKPEADQFIGSLGSVLENWNDDQARTAAIDRAIATNNGYLGGWFKKTFKKIGKAVKKVTKAVVVNPIKAVAKTTAKVTKTIVKNPATLINPIKSTKLAFSATKDLVKETVIKPTIAIVQHTIIDPTKAVVKITKKIIKFIIRFNPITLVIRAILLLAARNNWFNLAKHCYPGTLTETEAATKCGIDKAHWEKCCKCYNKFWSIFDKIGGIRSKLNKNLEKGKDKVYTGDYTVSKSFVTKGYKDRKKEVDDEIIADDKELKAKGAIEDDTKAADYYEAKNETVEVVANMITTNQATSVFADPNKVSVAASFCIPKDKQVLYDTSYTDGQFVRVEYDGKRGYARKKCFVNMSETPIYSITVNTATPLQSYASASSNKIQTLEKGASLLLNQSKSSGAFYYVTLTKTVNGKQQTVSGYALKTAFSAPQALNGFFKKIIKNKSTVTAPQTATVQRKNIVLTKIQPKVQKAKNAVVSKIGQLGILGIDDAVAIVSAVAALAGIVTTVLSYMGGVKQQKEQNKQNQQQLDNQQEQIEFEKQQAEAQAQEQQQQQQAAEQQQQLYINPNVAAVNQQTTSEAGLFSNKYVMYGAAAVGALLLLGLVKVGTTDNK